MCYTAIPNSPLLKRHENQEVAAYFSCHRPLTVLAILCQSLTLLLIGDTGLWRQPGVHQRSEWRLLFNCLTLSYRKSHQYRGLRPAKGVYLGLTYSGEWRLPVAQTHTHTHRHIHTRSHTSRIYISMISSLSPPEADLLPKAMMAMIRHEEDRTPFPRSSVALNTLLTKR
jgi:hypothetical protein